MKSEQFEQVYLLDWARINDNIWPYLIHIRNEGKRSYNEGKMAVKMGLKRGVSDLFLAKPSKGYGGFWIELKAPKTLINAAGKVNLEQKNFIELMKKEGYHAGVYFGWLEASRAIISYLDPHCPQTPDFIKSC